VRLTPVVATLTAVALAVPVAAAVLRSDAQTVIAVTLTPSTATLVPASAPSGTVVFRILNNDRGTRTFTIAGSTVSSIAPGKTARLSVLLRSTGFVPFTSGGKGRALLGGLLNVFQPCTNPASTTVNVQMAQDHGGITVSRSTVPCGTVTFVVTNAGTVPDSLHVFSLTSAVKGTTPELNPGQTASLTLTFPAKGTVNYESGDYPPAEPEYAGDFLEEGVITLS
jgi:hypothetical protein